MQTYIQRNRAKKRRGKKTIYSIFSSSCIYLYIFIIKFLFCLLGFVNYISRLLCKQLQLKRLTQRELMSVRQKDRKGEKDR